MKKLTNLVFFSFIILLINIFCIQVSQATPPGKKVNKLEEKELTATLYVISISSESSKLKGIEFIWIPESMEGQCIGKSYKFCKDVARDPKNRLLDKIFKRPPGRVLTAWVSEGDSHIFPENKQILEDLSKIYFIRELMNGLNGERHLDLIEKDRKIKAVVHWELWPNGANFRVLRVISK